MPTSSQSQPHEAASHWHAGAWAKARLQRTLLADESYRFYWLSRLITQTSQGAIIYALLVLVVDRTDQSIYNSLYVLCAIVPALAFGLPAGVAVDALPRRTTLVMLNFLRVLFVMALINTELSLVGIFAVALGLWTIHQFYAPAESALLASLVHPSQYVAAQSLANLALSIAQLLGLVVLAPVVLRLSGPAALFTICGALWVAGGVLVGLVQDRSENLSALASAAVRRPIKETLLSGWHAVRRDHAVYEVFIDDILVGVGGSALIVIVPLYLKGVLNTNAENTVFVFAPGAIGLLAGLRAASKIASLIGGRHTATASLVLFAACITAFGYVDEVLSFATNRLYIPIPLLADLLGLAPLTLMVMLLSIPAGFATTVCSVAARSVLLQRTPVQLRGQVIATQSVFQNVAALVPTLLAGVAADIIGVERVAVIIGGLVTVGALAALTIYRPASAAVRPARRPSA